MNTLSETHGSNHVLLLSCWPVEFFKLLKMSYDVIMKSRDVRFALKVGQIGPKWDNSGTFSDQSLVYFGSPNRNVSVFDLKRSLICQFWANLTSLSHMDIIVYHQTSEVYNDENMKKT